MRLVTDTEGMRVGTVSYGHADKIAGSGNGQRPDVRKSGGGPPVGPEWYTRPAVRSLLIARDVAGLYRALRDAGVSQRQIAGRTGQAQSEVCDYAEHRIMPRWWGPAGVWPRRRGCRRGRGRHILEGFEEG